MLNKKKLIIALIVGISSIGILFGILCLILSLTWKPTILDKYSFSDEEKITIANELNIPAEQISIEKMHYSHAKDSFFSITVTTSSIDILSDYEYQGLDNQTNKPYYYYYNDLHKIVCTVNSENPYELIFTISDWNENLYNLIK